MRSRAAQTLWDLRGSAGRPCAKRAPFRPARGPAGAAHKRGCAVPAELAPARAACYKPALFAVPGLFPGSAIPMHAALAQPRRRSPANEGEVMANDVSILAAQKRDKSGKGPARQLRMKGLIPAVCYGPYEKPLHVAIDPEAIKTALATPHKFNTVIKLTVDGGETRTVLFKDYEKDPVAAPTPHPHFPAFRLHKHLAPT